MRNRAAFGILVGGALAGLGDITYACTINYVRAGTSPIGVLQSVASGILGAAASQGGLATAALGLVLHLSIATSWSAGFYVMSRQLAFMSRRWIVSGALYGVLIYLGMYLVVLPLSNIPRKPVFVPWIVAVNLAAHILVIGIPMSWATHRATTDP